MSCDDIAAGDCCFPTNFQTETNQPETDRCYNMWTLLNKYAENEFLFQQTCENYNNMFSITGGVNHDPETCLYYRLTGRFSTSSWTCTDTKDLGYCSEVINKCSNKVDDMTNLRNWHDCCSKGSEVSCTELKKLTSESGSSWTKVCPLLAGCDKYQPTDCTYDQCPASLSECKEAISQCELLMPSLTVPPNTPTSWPRLKQFYDCCSSVTRPPPSPVSGSTPTWVMTLGIGVAVIIVAMICIIFAFRRNDKTRSSLDKIIDAM